MLYIDTMDQMDDYKVIVSAPSADISLTGLIDDDTFSYNSSADIGSSTIASAVEGATKGFTKGVAKKFPGGEMISNMIGDNLKSAKSTILGYDGSPNTSFSIRTHIFPNRMGNGSYKDIELQLSKLTQPNIKSLSDQLTSYLYEPSATAEFMTGGDPFKGKLISLSIGKWFSIMGDLFCDDISRNYSKWVDENHKPIYLEVTFSFKTYRVMSAEDIAGWIKQ